jgi:cytidine deaminase
MIDAVALLTALRAERAAIERELARVSAEIATIMARGRLLVWVAPCGLAGCREARGPF